MIASESGKKLILSVLTLRAAMAFLLNHVPINCALACSIQSVDTKPLVTTTQLVSFTDFVSCCKTWNKVFAVFIESVSCGVEYGTGVCVTLSTLALIH